MKIKPETAKLLVMQQEALNRAQEFVNALNEYESDELVRLHLPLSETDLKLPISEVFDWVLGVLHAQKQEIAKTEALIARQLRSK